MDRRQEAFTALFDAHFPTVVAYFRRRITAEADAEELAADVFRVAWEKQDPAAPFRRGWLIKVASDLLTDVYRRSGRRADVDAALMRRMEEAPVPLDVLDRLAVREAVRALSAREQERLRLTYWEGLSAAEAAEAMGTSTSAVWSLLTRARTRLHDALSDAAPTDPAPTDPAPAEPAPAAPNERTNR